MRCQCVYCVFQRLCKNTAASQRETRRRRRKGARVHCHCQYNESQNPLLPFSIVEYILELRQSSLTWVARTHQRPRGQQQQQEDKNIYLCINIDETRRQSKSKSQQLKESLTWTLDTVSDQTQAIASFDFVFIGTWFLVLKDRWRLSDERQEKKIFLLSKRVPDRTAVINLGGLFLFK